jgi:hypothetical protein
VTLYAKTGVHGIAIQDALSQGVLGESNAGAGVFGRASTGHGVHGEANSGPGVFASNNSASVGSIVADGGPGTAVHGHGGGGSVPASPPSTGIYGSAVGAATGVFGDTTTGVGVRGWATSGVGVSAKATSGQGVRGEATTGVGVKAIATTGVALDVAGRAVFSRSGRVSVPANAMYVDVTVPGGLSSTANVLATLQYKRGSVHVLAARPNYPSSGKVRIYLSAVASTTAATPLAWFVLG